MCSQIQILMTCMVTSRMRSSLKGWPLGCGIFLPLSSMYQDFARLQQVRNRRKKIKQKFQICVTVTISSATLSSSTTAALLLCSSCWKLMFRFHVLLFYFILLFWKILLFLNLIHFPSTFNPYLCYIFATTFSNKSRTHPLSHILITSYLRF